MNLPIIHGRKITFVIEKLAQRSGGAERVLIEVANALAKRGYVVEILSHEFRGRPPFYPLAFGVSHTNLRGLASLRSRLRQRIDKLRGPLHRWADAPAPLDRLAWHSRHDGFYKRLERHVDLTKPDVVIAFMPPAVTALARINGRHKPLKVASMHNAPEQDFENPDRWDPSPFDRRQRLKLMSQMDKIGILLPEYADWYDDHLRKKTVVIPNFVVPVSKSKLADARRKKRILCVGRLAAVKRHDVSLTAFARLAEQHPDWTLDIYGTGPIEEELASLIKSLKLEDRAFLHGHTPKIAEKYLTSTLLCHPAKFEGFPLAVTEALAAGLPVVGFADCSGLNRLVKDDVNGMLLDPGDGGFEARCDAVYNGLKCLMNDVEMTERLSAAGPKSMAQYRPDLIVDTWEEVCFQSTVKTKI